MTGPVTSTAVRPRTGLVRVGAGLGLGTMAGVVLLGAGSTVLLPVRVAAIDPDHKVTLLAVLHVFSASCGLVGVLVFGALSDRTRSRLGSRTPWILGGSVAALVLAVPLARADGYVATVFWWCLVVVALTAPAAAVAAVLPDRVAPARRATLSGVIGVAVLLGTAVGTVVGSLTRDDPARGFLVAGVLTAVLGVAAVLVAPDHPSAPGHRPPDGTLRLPRGTPDFYWVLWARLLLVVGYFMVNGFQLYLFTDRVGLSTAAAAAAVATTSVVFLVTAVAGSAVAGPLSDRLHRRKPFVVAASVLAAVAVLVPFALPTVAGMLGLAAVGGLAFGTYYAVDAALVSEVLPTAEHRARDLAVLAAATSGGQVLAPALSGALVGLGAGFAPLFVGAAVACLAGAVCVRPVRSVR